MTLYVTLELGRWTTLRWTQCSLCTHVFKTFSKLRGRGRRRTGSEHCSTCTRILELVNRCLNVLSELPAWGVFTLWGLGVFTLWTPGSECVQFPTLCMITLYVTCVTVVCVYSCIMYGVYHGTHYALRTIPLYSVYDCPLHNVMYDYFFVQCAWLHIMDTLRRYIICMIWRNTQV